MLISQWETHNFQSVLDETLQNGWPLSHLWILDAELLL
jgi:hypothetical protein